jgi:ABC-type transporter MlaC component
MSTDMELLQDVKDMSQKIRNNDWSSGMGYLLGYLWATLTPEQQDETAKSFREQLAEASEL